MLPCIENPLAHLLGNHYVSSLPFRIQRNAAILTAPSCLPHERCDAYKAKPSPRTCMLVTLPYWARKENIRQKNRHACDSLICSCSCFVLATKKNCLLARRIRCMQAIARDPKLCLRLDVHTTSDESHAKRMLVIVCPSCIECQWPSLLIPTPAAPNAT